MLTAAPYAFGNFFCCPIANNKALMSFSCVTVKQLQSINSVKRDSDNNVLMCSNVNIHYLFINH